MFDDFKVLVDFLTRIRAMRLLHQWDTALGQALALNRNALVHKFGHLVSLLWARLILGRFWDVVSRFPFEAAKNAAAAPNDKDPITGVIDVSAFGGTPEDFTARIAVCNRWLCIVLGWSPFVPVADVMPFPN